MSAVARRPWEVGPTAPVQGEVQKPKRGAPAKPPRERILDAASELFYRHGIRGVGVDAIAEAADSNKMTLYRHFASKDELVVECLREVACDADAIWKSFESTYPGDPLAQLHAWVRVGADCLVG